MRLLFFILFLIPLNIHAQFLDGVPQDDFQANMREKKSIEAMNKEFEASQLEIKKKFLELDAEKAKSLRYGELNKKEE